MSVILYMQTIKPKFSKIGIRKTRKEMGRSSFSGRKACYVNENFFKTPNFLNSYWAGFIAADGCITSKNDFNKRLFFKLSTKDLGHLKTFKDQIQHDGTLFIRNYKYSRGGIPCGTLESCNLEINNFKIVNDLFSNFGIHQNKTFTLLYPEKLVDKDIVDSYILGLIDGDGCVVKTGTELKVDYAGTKSVTSWVLRRFEEILGKPLSPSCHAKLGKIFRVTARNNDAKKIFLHYYNFIFSKNLPCLKRKWKQEHFDWIAEKGIRKQNGT